MTHFFIMWDLFFVSFKKLKLRMKNEKIITADKNL